MKKPLCPLSLCVIRSEVAGSARIRCFNIYKISYIICRKPVTRNLNGQGNRFVTGVRSKVMRFRVPLRRHRDRDRNRRHHYTCRCGPLHCVGATVDTEPDSDTDSDSDSDSDTDTDLENVNVGYTPFTYSYTITPPPVTLLPPSLSSKRHAFMHSCPHALPFPSIGGR